MYTLLETLMKMKATLAILVDQHHTSLGEIQQQYLSYATIDIHAAEQKIQTTPEAPNTKKDFLKFLDRDEREEIQK